MSQPVVGYANFTAQASANSSRGEEALCAARRLYSEATLPGEKTEDACRKLTEALHLCKTARFHFSAALDCAKLAWEYRPSSTTVARIA